MEKEIDNMNRLSSRFLELESSQQVIPTWRGQLSTFRCAPAGSSMFWKIAEDFPIQTKVSDGEYEPGDRHGALMVYGRVSGVWEIQLPNEVKKKGASSKDFVLLGLASTKVSIWDALEEPHKEIARWTIEVGDKVSPGSHFHTQIDLDDADNKFPKALSVPRLPGILHTPMDALEFVLGELFQTDWYEHSSQGNNEVNAWASCQRSRITNLLSWQTKTLQSTGGSPWTMLKRRKPDIDMLMGDN